MSPAQSIEDEVLGNIRRLPLGGSSAPGGTVADLSLPLDFLRRAADRVIQGSFRERFRVVVGEGVEHRPPDPPAAGPNPEWVHVVAERTVPLADGGSAWEEYRPADRGFKAPILSGRAVDWTSGALAENSSRRIGALRVQLTGPRYYAGPGDGGSLDILRQLVSMSEDVTVYASVERRHMEGVLSHVRTWTPGRGVRVTVIPEALPVSQWARDNAVSGIGAGTGVQLLAPRWAGRGEEGGTFIPGESFLMDGLAAAGVEVSQSRLLFEGGNLMMVEEESRRVLLVGEAEVHRNVGMTRDEALAAFRAEFKADECVILPAASFHIDLEVTVAPVVGQGKPVAFVVDSLAAVRVISRLASRRLGEAGLMTAADVAVCSDAAGLPLGLLDSLTRAVVPHAVGPGQYPYEFAKLFREGDMDSGVGNLQRVLLAMDWLEAEIGAQHGSGRGALTRATPGLAHHAAYLRSLRRAEKDRGAIARQLKQLGWKVVRVPALSADTVSLIAINGLWIGGKFLMSAYGGFFEELDKAAAEVVRAEGFEVLKVMTGETQRRGGGLHCAVGVM